MQTKHVQSGIRVCLAAALALAVSPWALAQRPVIPMAEAPSSAAVPAVAVPATEKPASELQELDEVVVTGERLYERIVKAEDKFFKLYNDLNDDDDFDTNCAQVPVDSETRIEQRFCMPSFFADAKAEQVRLSQLCLQMQYKDDDGNVANAPCYEPPSADQLFFHRRTEYVNNMLNVIRSDPDLAKMYVEVEALHRERAQYEHRYDELKAAKVAEQADKNKTRPSVR